MKIWCLLRDQFAHVSPVEAACSGRAEFVFDEIWDPATLVNNGPDLVLCVNDYLFDISRCLDAARAARIPTLILQDGILEWRCQYENPLFGAGGGAPQHQPVLADKIACLGQQSARQIAAWGNAVKVEVTGMPRLDYLLTRRLERKKRAKPRILVMTAKNPGFTPLQREVTAQSLRDVKEMLGLEKEVETWWRISKSLAEELKVENHLEQTASVELVKVLEEVDAVISTPSTAMIETMLMGRPVAALDYPNVPRFVPTAWTISGKEHISPVIAELLNPPEAKMAFQRDCLADCLECDGLASERVAELMLRMAEIGREARRTDIKLELPPDLLGRGKIFRVFDRPPLNALYPNQSVFTEKDVEQLQLRLARAENERTRLQMENLELRKRMQLGSWLKAGVKHLTQSR